MRKVWLAGLLVLMVARAWGDQVIMKSGKVYRGRIMGETLRSILISDPAPHFLPMRDVLTVVRESPPPEAPPPPEPKRYVLVETGLGASFFMSRDLSASPAAMLHFGGGFRLHPLVEIDADVDWHPAVSGDLSVTDGKSLRTYKHFGTYDGGFSFRVFPWGMNARAREPYVLVGYQWSRWLPKASDDFLKGNVWRLGAGFQGPLARSLFWDARVVYARTRYDAVQFLGNDGDLRSSLPNDHVTLSLNLAYHL